MFGCSSPNRNLSIADVFTATVRVAASGMAGMKLKMQNQVQQNQVQPLEVAPPRSAHVRIIQGDAEEEIQRFLRAVNSYAARVAKEPRVSFQQHLSSIFAARNDEGERRGSRSRRH